MVNEKNKWIFSNFSFPIVSVIAEYIVAISSGQAGSWCSLAHTQDNLALMQFTSITGMWGLTFIIAWTASAMNWFWDKRFEIANIKKSIILFSVIIISVFLFGQIRNRFFHQIPKPFGLHQLSITNP